MNELRTARAHGIPLSELRSWKPEDGLLAEALTLYEGSLHTCGHPVWDALDPATEGRWSSPLPTRCHACTAVAHRVKEYDPHKVDAFEALLFSAELKPPQTHA